jgi:hypothetical protein
VAQLAQLESERGEVWFWDLGRDCHRFSPPSTLLGHSVRSCTKVQMSAPLMKGTSMTDAAAKSVKKTPNYLAVEGMLAENEHILTSIAANIQSGSHPVLGLLALTETRVIFHGKYAFAKHSRTLNLAQITTIDVNGSVLGATIRVTLGGATEAFRANYKAAKGFVDEVHVRLNNAASESHAGSPLSAADELTKIAALHAQGVLTDEEFAAAKAKALG